MDRHTDGAQVQRLEVVELGRRRRWTAEAKQRIVEESFAGHRQASATARRHGISNSLLFAWRKAYRDGRRTGVQPGGFVPAVMVDDQPAPTSPAAGRLEIVTRNGYRVIVDPAVGEATLFKVLAVLARS
jgi:transposase